MATTTEQIHCANCEKPMNGDQRTEEHYDRTVGLWFCSTACDHEHRRRRFESRNTMTKADALRILRVMVRIEQQIEWARSEGRWKDHAELCRLFGGLTWKQFECSIAGEL